ncbi:unnamed protein product [Ranitomeya imitator]|uniref:Amine oxidase domain-containing protein n=1 Tax=Ranitomeya imitator TaxID=111125 RepID=A0ABN9LSB2_9NEOB|nr:unnamed protein product [Ranitomeya imitator]
MMTLLSRKTATSSSRETAMHGPDRREEQERRRKKVARQVPLLAILKMIPQHLALFLLKSGLLHRLSPVFHLAESSHQDVVRGLTSNKELQTVFSYLFYGVPPNDSSFMINALLLHHYKRGAWYPRGGSSEIAFHMIPVIERAGGKVLVKAPVKRILLNNGRVTGVAVQRKDKEICIYAPVVISDAGIFNTYEQLLPFVVKKKPEVESLLSSLQYGMGCFLVFIGIRGTSDELGLKSTNLWIYTESDLNSLMEKFQSLEYEEVCKQLPLMFITFPSAKDPTYSQRHPGHSCMTLLTMAPYDWFHQWSDQKPRNRGEEYHTMKMMLANHMVERAIKEFPQLQGKIEYLEAATPVSNEFYLRAPKGSMYGAEQNCSRYQCDIISRMRSQTAVSGLYLTASLREALGIYGSMDSHWDSDKGPTSAAHFSLILNGCFNKKVSIRPLYIKGRMSSAVGWQVQYTEDCYVPLRCPQ